MNHNQIRKKYWKHVLSVKGILIIAKVELIERMNLSPQFTHLDTCEAAALKIVRTWEKS